MAAKPTSDVTEVKNPLKDFITKDLLEELFSRFKEGLFIAHSSDKSNPIQIGCHFPIKMTGMHSVLTGALRRVLSGLERKYPDVPTSGPDADHMIVCTEAEPPKCETKIGNSLARPIGMPPRATMSGAPEAA